MGSVTSTLKPKDGVMIRESGYGKRRSVKIVLKDYKAVFVDNAGTVAYFGKALCTLPEGVVVFGGAVLNFQAKIDGGDGSTTGIFTAFDGDVALGTVTAASDATLSSTEQDLIPTTSTTQAVAGVTQVTGKSTGTEAPKLFDGSGTAKSVFLNMLVDDTDHNVGGAANSGLILNGTIEFNFETVGDV